MRARILSNLARSEDAAVAPIVAISLFGLVAVGGIAFDYARMATLDTELQQAADQAALAAATQLDGKPGACQRAADAARKLIANQTRFANDGGGLPVTIDVADASDLPCNSTSGGVLFYKDKGKSAHPDKADDVAGAKFVEVTVNSREAFFALTPVVAVLRSGSLTGKAFAGLGSAICKVPPLMMCNPDEPSTNTNKYLDFDADSKHGIGLKLVGDGSYTAGNFGFLETSAPGANALLAALGWDTPPGDCAAIDGVTTKTGINASVIDGINTRFDMPGTGNSCPQEGPGKPGSCSPSYNVRKDLVRTSSSSSCDWQENDASPTNYQDKRYRPPSAATIANTPEIMGLPRDLCHAWSVDGSCAATTGNARVGDGQWDINAYWRSNYGASYSGQVGLGYGTQPHGYPTRYEVYLWELDNPSNIKTPKSVSGGKAAYSTPVPNMCVNKSGIVPSEEDVDRRRISIAVLNCMALKIKGNEKDQPVAKWVDVFLVEPSVDRKKCKPGGPGSSTCNTAYTNKTDLYVEVIGQTNSGTSGPTAGQVVRHDVPYLIE